MSTTPAQTIIPKSPYANPWSAPSDAEAIERWTGGKPIVYEDAAFEIEWTKKTATIEYSKPNVHLMVSDKGGGKGMEQEAIGDVHIGAGHTALFLQGAHDMEHLAVARNPLLKGKQILILTGESTTVNRWKASQYDFNFVDKPISQVSLRELEQYEAVVNCFCFYESVNEYYSKMKPFLQRLYEKRLFWTRPLYAVLGEAAELVYSRVKGYDETKQNKVMLVYILRQSRHLGVSIAAATQRLPSLDLDARSLGDYLSFKSQGIMGLPEDFEFLYRYYDPDWMQDMAPEELAMLTDRGAIGRGFVKPATGLGQMKDKDGNLISWHKEEWENILDLLGIEPAERKERVEITDKELAEDPIKDKQHLLAIRIYYLDIDHEGKPMSEEKTAIKMGLNGKTFVWRAIQEHDSKVAFTGRCSTCVRAGGPDSEELSIKQVKRSRKDANKQAVSGKKPVELRDVGP